MQLSDFDFDLPEGLIAQSPASPRDHARMLHVPAPVGFYDRHVYDLPELLRPGDCLVFNDTKVIPARLYGRRGDLKVEILLDRPEDERGAWRAFAHPRRKLKDGQDIEFADGFSCTVEARHPEGTVTVRFNKPESLMEMLERHGHIPLPPYIKRGDGAQDRADYQTVYAKNPGAVAAPTAGLHFTPELLARLDTRGVERLHVTLHVGAGTFAPVRAEEVSEHLMHAEWGHLTPEVAERLNAAKAAGRRVVAVGTTSLRLLESAAREDGTIMPFCDFTSIFITPGYRFRAVDVLMTNFHLPKTTLFMLVSAFCGLSRMKEAYTHAAANGYRFYSYGDSSLLERVDRT